MPKERLSKYSGRKELHLGTANFFQKYGGIKGKKVGVASYISILSKAKENVKLLDYAGDYGAPNYIRRPFLRNFNFATKIDINHPKFAKGDLRSLLVKQSSMFQTTRCSILYLRGGQELRSWDRKKIREFGKEVSELKNEGVIGEIGVSIYMPNEIEFFSNLLPKVDLFQVPLNLLNRKFDKALKVQKNVSESTKFVARSVLLQGALVSRLESIPEKLIDLKSSIKELNHSLNLSNYSSLDLCLGYINTIDWVDAIVLGVESGYQLEENMKILNSPKFSTQFFETLNIEDSNQSDPRYW